MAQYHGNSIERKLVNHRNNLKILLIVGIIAVVLNIVLDGIFLDTLIWAIAILLGYQWYKISAAFMVDKRQYEYDQLSNYQKYFLIVWIIAAISSVIFWGFDIDLLFGILVVGLVTYLMNQFLTEAQPLVLGSPRQHQFNSTSSESSTTHIRPLSSYCGNCGQGLEEGVKFCSSCGEAVEY